jgi:signal transduction histidine kinase
MAGRLFDVDVVPLGAEGSLIVGEDVTARNRDQERLARSERLAMVGQMLAQITHEVRNPLNAMSLHAELLAEDIEDPEHRAILATITAQIRRLEGLTARYLELSRGRRPELSPANPAELAREIVRLEEEALRRAGVRVELSGEVGLVELDAEALRRTLHNLLRNAVEAGAHLVRVRIGEEGGQLRVEMEDDGPGMAPEEAARAFEPFFTTKARGTGLGLAISRQEVEDVGGSLRCESRPGKGSIFSVRLPMQAC